MENEQVETMISPQVPGPHWGPKALQLPSDTKRELLSSIGLFICIELLGFWFGVGATLGAKMVNSLEELLSR